MISTSFARSLVLLVVIGAASTLVGCGGAPEGTEPSADENVGKSEEAITDGATNYVCADSLWLRSQDSTAGARIAEMTYGSTFNVHSVDWSAGMAYGYSFQLQRWGWANKNYLSVSCGGVVGGGGTI